MARLVSGSWGCEGRSATQQPGHAAATSRQLGLRNSRAVTARFQRDAEPLLPNIASKPKNSMVMVNMMSMGVMSRTALRENPSAQNPLSALAYALNARDRNPLMVADRKILPPMGGRTGKEHSPPVGLSDPSGLNRCMLCGGQWLPDLLTCRHRCCKVFRAT